MISCKRRLPGNTRLHATISIAAFFGLLFAAPVRADDAASRKPGLWEVKTSIDDRGRAVTVQQCIDAATDQMLQSSAGPLAAPICGKPDVKKSEGGMTIEDRKSVV